MYKKLLKLKLICIFILLLTSCQNSEHKYTLDQDKIYPLKVLFYDSETFYSTYGRGIVDNFPNVEVEIIPYKQAYHSGEPPLKKIMELITL